MKKYLFILWINLFGCSKTATTFEISSNEDLIKLSKNTSFKLLEKKTKNFLTSQEIINSPFEYKLIKTIPTEHSFDIILLLATKSKNHNILVRTVAKNSSKIVDTFLLAAIDNHTQESFCKGKITNKKKVTRWCEEFQETKYLNQKGEFVTLHK